MQKQSLPPLPSVRHLLDIFGTQANKSLGQNFLLDQNVTDKLVRQAFEPSVRLNKSYSPIMVEIGCGPGSLTRSLLLSERVKKVHAIEKDQRFRPLLDQLVEASNGRLHVTYGDAMKLNPSDLGLALQGDFHVIGNLPFNIATELTFKFLTQSYYSQQFFQPSCNTVMTFMYQKIVAERMVATPLQINQRSKLGVMAQCLSRPKIIYDVPSTVFVPRPKVDAAVVHFLPLEKPLISIPLEEFRLMLSIVFGQPRKMLKGILPKLVSQIQIDSPIKTESQQTSCLKAKLVRLADIDFNRRSSQLSNEEWLHLADVYYKMKVGEI